MQKDLCSRCFNALNKFVRSFTKSTKLLTINHQQQQTCVLYTSSISPPSYYYEAFACFDDGAFDLVVDASLGALSGLSYI